MTDSVAAPRIPYGAWPSPISAADVAKGQVTVSFPLVRGTDVWWQEGRPEEGGRVTVVHCDATGNRRALLPSPLSYLGVLGPKERTRKLLEELRAQGEAFPDSWPARLHSPVGIDIGAETPEEIALSIVAEIRAVCAGRRAGFLRDRDAPIHDDFSVTLAATDVPFGPRPVVAHESASVMVCRSS